MKILLTGASGFIGKALLPALITDEHQVTLLSRKSMDIPVGIDEIIANPQQWPEAVKGKYYDICIHLAWIATPGVYGTSPENELFGHMTPDLADTLFQGGLPHFLGLGTCIEYSPGQSQPCIPGKTAIIPESIYGMAKALARQGVADSAARHGKGYTWTRLFHPYGPGEHPARIPSTFLKSLAEGMPLILKTPDSSKDWIEIRDVVSAIMAIVQNGKPLNEINIGTGIGTRIGKLAELSADILDAPRYLVQNSPIPEIDPYPTHVADISSLVAIGWQPRIPVQDGLRTLSQNLKLNPIK